jgi:hypothetical protein
LGFEAYPALVNTSARQAIARRLPSPLAFNHVIVKVVLEGKELWLDPTRSHQGGGLWTRALPPFRKALVIKRGVTALEDLRPYGLENAGVEVRSVFRMKDYSSPVPLMVRSVYRGREADEMREHLARVDEADLAKARLNFYARLYPGIGQSREPVIQDDRRANALIFSEWYQIPDLWKHDPKSHQWEAAFFADNVASALEAPGTRLRKMPLGIPNPLRREQQVEVHLPDGDWNIPGTKTYISHDAFSFSHERWLDGAVFHCHYRLETTASEVAATNTAAHLRKLEEMDDLIGDTLSRPDDSFQGMLARTNWLMAVIGILGFAASVAVSVRVWRQGRSSAPTVEEAPAPENADAVPLQGLGGWLILLGGKLCFALVARVFVLAKSWNAYFSSPVWQGMATSTGEHYHPLFAPLLIFEMLASVGLLVANVLIIALFFSKRRLFPKAYIVWVVLGTLVFVVEGVAGRFIPMIAEATDDDKSLREFATVLGGVIIWCSYVLKSRRVKATFVR